MKTIITSTIILAVTLAFAQAPPQGISYQAVATDAQGVELVSQPIGVRATVISGLPSGTSEWIEEHSATTDQFGLFTIIIGQGTPAGGVQSAFANINWGSGFHYLKIEMDATGGTNYSLMGVDQMFSVPYALYSGKADTSNYAVNGSLDAWKLFGNAGTNPSVNFLGTTDNVPLSFRVNNQNAGRIDHTLKNTSLGFHSLNSNTTGYHNTAVGDSALASNTNSEANTAIGAMALKYNVGGHYNTATGNQALHFNNGGNDNTANGTFALNFNTTGSGNTAIGKEALVSNTIGNSNTATGALSLYSNTTGDNNTALGAGADVTSGALTNATAIGCNAKVGASNSLVLGGTGAYAVNVGIGITIPSQKLHVSGSGLATAWNTTSDIRFKENIHPLTSSLENVLRLSGVSYFWKYNEYAERGFSKDKQIGLIAQEVEKIYPELVTTDADGYKSVDYSKLTPILLEAIKEQQAEIEKLKLLEKRIIDIESAITDQQGVKAENK